MKRFLFISFVLTFVMSSCQAKAAPTVDPAQVQASAIAMANTMAAQTQAAIPPTLVPTDTLIPSPSPLPSPTDLPLLPITTDTPLTVTSPSPNQNTDPCNGPLTNNPKAAPDAGKIGSNVKIVNTTKASITISLYLNKNQQGECGYKSFVLSPTSSITIANSLPYGCYNLFALINDPKKPSQASGGPVCITGPDKTTINVLAETIKVTGP